MRELTNIVRHGSLMGHPLPVLLKISHASVTEYAHHLLHGRLFVAERVSGRLLVAHPSGGGWAVMIRLHGKRGFSEERFRMTLLDLVDQVQLFSVRRPAWRPWLLKPLKNQMKRSIALKEAYGNFSNGRRERTAADINRRP